MRRAARAAAVAAVALACALPGGPASAAPDETIIEGEHLRLVSVTSEQMTSLDPGEVATWDVGVAVTTPGEATVDVSLEVLTATPDAFALRVLRCAERWTASGCPGGAVALAEPPVVSGTSAALDRTDGAEAPWYRMEVTMVGAGDAVADLRLVADGVGEEISAGGGSGPGDGGSPGGGGAGGAGGAAPPSTAPPTLPGTGAAVLGQLLLALGAVLVGVLTARLGRVASRRATRDAGAGT